MYTPEDRQKHIGRASPARGVPRGFLMCNRFCKKKGVEGGKWGGDLGSTPKKIWNFQNNV